MAATEPRYSIVAAVDLCPASAHSSQISFVSTAIAIHLSTGENIASVSPVLIMSSCTKSKSFVSIPSAVIARITAQRVVIANENSGFLLFITSAQADAVIVTAPAFIITSIKAEKVF